MGNDRFHAEVKSGGFLPGVMQRWPLLTWKLLDHAALNHGDSEVVTLTAAGGTHRSNWREVRQRAKRLSKAMVRLGIRQGDRIATLAWNGHRHLECLFGISGMGAIAHTINPRLFEDQIAYIANHAEDRIIFLDLSFVELVEKLAPRFEAVEHYVLLADRADMPRESSVPFLCYEDLLAGEDDDFTWVELDEEAPAGLCYTSGTTGDPKGVLYSHRSTVLHSFAALQPDAFALSARSAVLPIVPMYHANGWGLPYAAAMVGAKFVMGGAHFDPVALRDLIVAEGVTITAAVPTIWLAMLHHLEQTGKDLGALQRVAIGGSAVPRSMIEAFETRYGVEVIQLWGMTELSPVGTIGTLCARANDLPADERIDRKCKQGRPLFGVEIAIKDEDGQILPRDGKSSGGLVARGPWVVDRYVDGKCALDEDGYFPTGDIATIDTLGYMQIVDRAKDVIKSGGEWISSIELENAAVGCEGVAEAAVIGIKHPKWDERPLLVVVRKDGSNVSAEEILDYLKTCVARWWLPDEIIFVAEIPHTPTGKILKSELRKQFEDYQFKQRQ